MSFYRDVICSARKQDGVPCQMWEGIRMQWVHVRRLSAVYYVMLVAGRAVKEGGNAEVMMHLSMSIVIVKVCANAILQMVARTNVVVAANQVSWTRTPRSRHCALL